MFSEQRGSLTQNRRIANLVSKNDVFVYLGHGIFGMQSDSGWNQFSAEVWSSLREEP